MESAGRPSYEELERLVAEQVAVIAGQAALIERQAALIEGLTARAEELAARVAELERRLGTDSSTSSRPPSSDSPFTKAPKRSSRTASGRPRGKQPGEPGQTRNMVADPDEVITL
ncbi:DUF6444 domain-containing protein, partial [Pseudofrankia asymbiotica]